MIDVPFDGPHARLRLTFDSKSFVPGLDPEAWPRATVTYEGGGLSGTISVSFFEWAMPQFVRALATAHRNLRGTASLDSEEGDFLLAVTFGGRGDATLTGHLKPRYDNDTKLVYEIATDQSYVGLALVALNMLSP